MLYSLSKLIRPSKSISYHDTEGCNKDAQWENETNPSKDQQTSTSSMCNHHSDEHNSSKAKNIEQS